MHIYIYAHTTTAKLYMYMHIYELYFILKKIITNCFHFLLFIYILIYIYIGYVFMLIKCLKDDNEWPFFF